jgi:hypothetical protein
MGSDRDYDSVNKVMQQASDDGVLTILGEKLMMQVDTVCRDARGLAGELTPRGVREHRGVAERMYESFPQVFEKGGYIESRSTNVVRCILSMSAFDERLKEFNPSLNISRESSKRNMWYMADYSHRDSMKREIRHVVDSVENYTVHPERLISSIFADPKWVKVNIKDESKFMISLWRMAADMQDVDYLGIDLFPYFTDEELYECFSVQNLNMYLYCGNTKRFGKYVKEDIRPLLENIIETADQVIKDSSQIATLRFGHDVNVTPLAMLMGLESDSVAVEVEDLNKVAGIWQSSIITPMCSNIQIIFFRNMKDRDDIIIKILRNEKEAGIPIKTDVFPYYHWKDARAYFIKQLN